MNVPQGEGPAPARGGFLGVVRKAENLFSTVLLSLVTLLLLVTIGARLFGISSIRASNEYIRHLVLWISFAGAMITTREGRHLSLSIGVERLPETSRYWVNAVTALVSAMVCTVLAFASLSFILSGFDVSMRIGVFPVRVATLIMPLGFALMSVRFVLQAPRGDGRRWIAAIGILAGLVLGSSALLNALLAFVPASSPFSAWLGGAAPALAEALAPAFSALHLPLILILAACIFLGAPIFVLLGGMAALFFLHTGGALETSANQAYTMLTGDVIPSIPLFTLAGYIISESRSGERLVRLFRAFFGWLPGGLAFMSILICAFLTTFTGASGVTIIAVGSLLLFILRENGYDERFSTGLLTASGSIGLLFPPSLPVILYGVVAMTNIKQMFVAGILPGLFLILCLAAMGVWSALRKKIPRTRFSAREALPAFGISIGEIILPFLILALFLLGITTLVETGAVAVLYALILEVFIHRDLKLRQLPAVFFKSVVILGGILTILANANALSYYIVDAEIPMQLTHWLRTYIHSPIVFLLLLNLVLLVKGFFMDIFSAITIVVPLIAPLGALYGINTVHLGIIFLANLELGYLTPPMGLNLFLASYRFNKPLVRIYRDVLPFQLAMLIAVLIITYVPWMTTALLGVFKF
jgi:tripartite ATP-independent transporter DctM subunit